MVDVNTDNNSINISVSTSGSSGSVNATNNAAQYWADKAREWAISESTVSGEDNSSKWYANKSKQYKEGAESAVNGFSSIVNNATTEFNTLVSGAESNINGLTSDFSNLYDEKSGALQSEYTGYSSDLDSAKTAAIADIQTVGIENYNNVSGAGATALNDITTAKNTAIGAVQSEGDTQVARVQSTGFYMEDGKLYYIDEEGNPKEFESGGGLEVCDIGMALYIDETKGLRRYLNGQIVDINTNTQAFLNRLKDITTLHPSLLCTEDEWQTAKTKSAFGQVGKFVFNYSGDEVVSVRIPRVVNVQGLFDLQNLGLTVAESLPNIRAKLSPYGGSSDIPNTVSGAVYTEVDRGMSGGYTGWVTETNHKEKFDASRYSSTYQDNAPVQPEAIQYPYFIQIATGSETEANITNIIEVNNPYTFGMFQYTDVELNNLSWLKATSSFVPKSTYPSLYDWALSLYNQEKEGFKGINDEYSNADWVINTTDETFRTPIIASVNNALDKRFLVDKKEATDIDPTWYNRYSDGYIEQGGIINVSVGPDKYPVCTLLKPYRDTTYVISNNILQTAATQNWGAGSMSVYTSGKTVTQFQFVSDGVTNCVGYHWKTVGYGEIPTVEDIADNFNLYFYAGETVQNANLINAGRIGEQLVGKLDKKDVKAYIVETYQNGTSWYRVYSDGWIEQGGIVSGSNWTSDNSFITLNFIKEFSDTDYIFLKTIKTSYANELHSLNFGYTDKTRSSIKLGGCTSTYIQEQSWYACGY